METHLDETSTFTGLMIAIVAFDGVHQGHQAVIKEAVKKVEITGGWPSVVYTFNPPPRCYFQAAQVLTSVPKKLMLLEQLGLDYVVIVWFDKVYAIRPLLFLLNI